MTYCSIFVRSSDAHTVAAQVIDIALAAGYVRYDPFNGLPGRAYPQAIRVFAAPAHKGWVRLLGEWDVALSELLSKTTSPVVWVKLEGSIGTVEIWQDGAQVALPALDSAPHLVPKPAERSWVDVLPPDVQALNTHPQQAEKLINRLSTSLLAKSGGADQQAAAAALLSGGERWDSPAGIHIVRVLSALGIDDWRDPDFITLRDAYALQARRQRRPNATPLPGDAATMAAVPNALDFLPVYAGKG